MKKLKKLSIAASICISLGACSSGWKPYGHFAETQDGTVVHSTMYQNAMGALGRKDYDSALRAFQSLNRTYRESPSALNGLALAYAGLNEMDKARFMFETALKADPDNETAIEGLARIDNAPRRQSQAAAAPAGNTVNDEGHEMTMADKAMADKAMADKTMMADGELQDGQEMTLSSSKPLPLVRSSRSDENSTMAKETMAAKETPVPASLMEKPVSIVVANGNGQIGLAGAVALRLRRQDVPVEFATNADRFDYGQSVVVYRPGQLAYAEKVKAALMFDAVLMEEAQAPHDVIVILGANAV